MAQNRYNVLNYLIDLEAYIKEHISLILTEISFEEEYFNNNVNKDFNKSLNYILVEGKSDYDFFRNQKLKNILNDNNYYISIDAIKNFTKEKNQQNNESNPFNKELIINIIKAKMLCDFFKNNSLYAIVDRDFDDEYPNSSIITQNILSNDSHDLETLMLSTDGNIAKNLAITNLNDDFFNRALYMAYQIGCVKYAISNNKEFLNFQISHNFNQYFKNEKLNIEKYVVYLSIQNKNKTNIFQQITKLLKKDNKIDSQNNFITSFENFKNNKPQDTWFIINGHDFTEALQFLLNKDLNVSQLLINSYDNSKFVNCNLYKKMQRKNLTK